MILTYVALLVCSLVGVAIGQWMQSRGYGMFMKSFQEYSQGEEGLCRCWDICTCKEAAKR